MPQTKKCKQPKGIAVSGNEAKGSGVKSRIGLDFDKLREAGWTISERQSSSGDKVLFWYVNPSGKTIKSSRDVEKQLREKGTEESFVLETNESPLEANVTDNVPAHHEEDSDFDDSDYMNHQKKWLWRKARRNGKFLQKRLQQQAVKRDFFFTIYWFVVTFFVVVSFTLEENNFTFPCSREDSSSV